MFGWTKDYVPVGGKGQGVTCPGGGFLQYAFMFITIGWLVLLTVQQSERASAVLSHRLPIFQNNNTETYTTTKGNTNVDYMQTEEYKYLSKGKNMSWRFPKEMTFLEALPTCETFKCLRDAHLQPKGDAKYNFPHFIIAGYSKSASTSLYKYLIRHPDVVVPKKKEPSLFTDRCTFEGKRMDCPDWRVREYIQDLLRSRSFATKVKGQRAVFEATPRIMDLGPVFAETLYELMPWVKLVASYREPISRSISKYVMLVDKLNVGCMAENDLTWCLLKDKTPILGNPKKSYYSHPLQAWIDNFPKEQLLLIQYEDLVGERQAEELVRLKKHCRIHPEGWPMKEKDYRKIIERVKPDVEEFVRLLDLHGLGNGTRWYQNWKKVWDDNLARCVDGMCKIQLS